MVSLLPGRPAARLSDHCTMNRRLSQVSPVTSFCQPSDAQKKRPSSAAGGPPLGHTGELFEFKQLVRWDAQRLGDVEQQRDTWNGAGRFHLLDVIFAVVKAFGQFLLGHSARLAIVQDVEADLNHNLAMLSVHKLTPRCNWFLWQKERVI